jgi:hypothetical protein
VHTVRKRRLVVNRIDPQQLLIGDREPRVLQAHESNVVHKWKISRKPPARLKQVWRCYRMQHQAYFDAATLIFQPKNSKYRLVESASRLHNIVMDLVNCRVDGNTDHERRMLYVRPGGNNLRPSESTAIA